MDNGLGHDDGRTVVMDADANADRTDANTQQTVRPDRPSDLRRVRHEPAYPASKCVCEHYVSRSADTSTPIEPRVTSKQYSVANNGGRDGLEVGAYTSPRVAPCPREGCAMPVRSRPGIEHAR